jgi:hypothetical protein
MFAWVLLLQAGVGATLVRRLNDNQIEFSCGETSLGLLLPFSRQVTFAVDESASKINTVLQKELAQECHLVCDGRTLPSDTVLCSYLHLDTRLICTHQEYHFVGFRPPIAPELHAKFLEYQKNKKANKNPNAEKEYPYTSSEIIADNLEGSIAGYLLHFLEHHFGPIHPFLTYKGPDTGIYSLQTGEQKMKGSQLKHDSHDDSPIRVSLTADFGAGTREAAYVSQLMIKDFNPHFTLHGGDVYYVGDMGEVSSNTLGIPPENTKYGVKFPIGSLGGFAMNGNHEMYSRGYGYFDELLPTMGIVNQTTGKPSGQGASYSALENAYWRVIDLDTGYHTYSEFTIESDNNTQPLPVIEWLKNEVKIGDSQDVRGIILISHHQYFSAFGKSAPSKATPSQIAALLPANRTILWLWGHEHRLAFYQQNFNQSGLDINVFGRCVGNGGFPSSVHQQPERSRESRLRAYDDRLYEIDVGFVKVPVGYNGWVFLTFQANTLAVEYRSLMHDASGNLSNTQSALLVTEQFTVDPKGSLVQVNFTIVDKNITVVSHA